MMWPPRPCSLCGVKPMCAITGMPARTIRLICFALRTPPSSFTAWQPVSFMNRIAVASASSGPFSYEPNGMSAMTSARFAPRTTARGERDQLVDGDRDRRVVAEDRVAGGVADEQEIDARLVEDARRQEVVAGEPGDLDPRLLGPLEVPRAHLLEARIPDSPTVRTLLVGHAPTVDPRASPLQIVTYFVRSPTGTCRRRSGSTRTTPSHGGRARP